MKKYRYLLIGIISVLTCFSSCDYLDLEPEDGVILERFWQTKEEVNSGVMGCYAAMMDADVMLKVYAWGENRAELSLGVRTTKAASTDWVSIQNGEVATTNSFTSWGKFYTVINNCNTVLEFAKKTQTIDQSFTIEQLKAYEAEAICIRSLMYFYLVRTFGDVPYVTVASTNDGQNYMPVKISQEAILDSLVYSLRSVDRSQNGTSMGIPFNYGSNPAYNKGRFTVWGLKALLADIYLWKEDYFNAEREASQIINSGQFSLFPIAKDEVQAEDAMGNPCVAYYPVEGDVNNFFQSLYVDGNSVESILELQFATDHENPFFGMFSAADGYIQPNSDYLQYELFIPSGIDRSWFDIRTEGVSYKQGLVWKWIGLDRNLYSFRERTRSFSNWIFYRLPDIYLMKAEALNQLGKQSGDQAQLEASLALVKEIRSRAAAPESTDLFPEGTLIDANLLEEFILQERGREFTFEGKRWFDILRNAKRDNYAGIDYLLRLAVYAATPDKATSLQNKWKGNHNSHYYPISDAELKNNKNLVQNPFYQN
ncbi:RagB/SusD family nutrient uptake outer membrane protein [Viscerimonas tarda]